MRCYLTRLGGLLCNRLAAYLSGFAAFVIAPCYGLAIDIIENGGLVPASQAPKSPVFSLFSTVVALWKCRELVVLTVNLLVVGACTQSGVL